MRRLLAWTGFGLATLFAGYWVFIDLSQVITAMTFGTRLDVPPSLWVMTGLYVLHVVVACSAWLTGLRGHVAERWRVATAGTLVAVVASWPSLALLYVRLWGG